jgi:NAD(P)-dependent dehydrogenase (short-subunit alcohol dehydrogenase family)
LTSGSGCGGGFEVAQHFTSELDAVLALNVRAALLLSREAARVMKAHGRGGSLL